MRRGGNLSCLATFVGESVTDRGSNPSYPKPPSSKPTLGLSLVLYCLNLRQPPRLSNGCKFGRFWQPPSHWSVDVQATFSGGVGLLASCCCMLLVAKDR